VLSYFKLLSVQLLVDRCMLPDGHLSFVKPSHSTLPGGVESASLAAICGHHTRPLRVPLGEGGRAAICESSRVQSNSEAKNEVAAGRARVAWTRVVGKRDGGSPDGCH
jgi:hypothetical protein